MTAGREPEHALRDIGALLRENEALRAENLALRELCLANATAKQQAARYKAELAEILGSRAWALVRHGRRLATFFRRQKAFPPANERWDRLRCARSRSIPAPPGQKVSVIVPNYNHAPYLEERLRSIFDQTYPPREVIFLDDASTDDSVAVARRLASESPVPVRFVLNESNSGSTFRQWLKGIDLAGGDLVWIAESDDTCRPELLERLVSAFVDPEVTLAYCQSAMIGHDGQQYAADYLSDTENLSPVRWRYPYCVSGDEEVELALSQRNTIPNASAVVFRRPDLIEERDELGTLRLAGDWLFYAMRVRRGKIAYIPESLNGHRHHDGTVRSGFERAVELFEEQLRVKGRIFEAFPVTADAISGSMARGFAEYADRTRELGLRTPMTAHPRLRPHIDRIRDLARTQQLALEDRRVLVVLSGVSDEPEPISAIRLANALARRFRVFLCNALPGVLDPRAVSRVDPRVVWLEGTLGIRPWSWDGEPHSEARASSRRAEVIRELIAFHGIDAIHVSGDPARRLVVAAGLERTIRRIEAPGARGCRPACADRRHLGVRRDTRSTGQTRTPDRHLPISLHDANSAPRPAS
jgi:glycosyltransferase involved in cell wall biosynthesis